MRSYGVFLLQMEQMGGTVVSTTDKYVKRISGLCSEGVYAFEEHSICTTNSSITAVATSAQPSMIRPQAQARKIRIF